LTIAGAFVHGALSGFGLMASAATAELAAAHLTGSALPDYAAAFHPARFADPAYLDRLAAWGDSAQL
jgi:glycine/D-amino acid oxidase-like deaminating enzyme